MSRPAADDLCRPTAPPAAERSAADAQADSGADDRADDPGGDRAKKPSGRVRHDEKMTVYVTSDELLDLEHTRLVLRRSHGLAVDRGRIVREAIALVLADFEAQGDHSALVRRLTEE